jgi:glutamyl-tRNA reductase
MRFTAIGTNHHFSPLEVRDRLSFSKKKLRETYRFLGAIPGIRSFWILSTCNRSEIYVWSQGELDLPKIFCEAHGMSQEKPNPFLYIHKNQNALRHFVRVICGLDSQVVGESQILGQVRQAVRYSEEMGALDPFAKGFVLQAIKAAEKVRFETGAERFSGTVADAAFDLIRRNDPLVREKKFLLIGTGKIMGLFVPLLVCEGICPIIVSNRNHEKAVEWAQETGGTTASLEDLAGLIPETDIIISATSCPHAVLHKEHFRNQKKPVLVLDPAVPRDAEPAIKEITGVRLFDLDDLAFAGADDRQKGWVKAAEIGVQEECEALWKELLRLEAEKAPSL